MDPCWGTWGTCTKETTHAEQRPYAAKKKSEHRTARWPSECKLYIAPEINGGHVKSPVEGSECDTRKEDDAGHLNTFIIVSTTILGEYSIQFDRA